MTDSNLRAEASTGISADAIGDCHAAVRLELALAIKGRCSPAEYGARTTHTVGARVETAISGTVQIGPFGGRARSAPEKHDNGGETTHVHILAGALPSEIPELGSHHIGRARVCPTTCRSAANAQVPVKRITAARSRGRRPRRRGTRLPLRGAEWRSAAATAGSAASGSSRALTGC